MRGNTQSTLLSPVKNMRYYYTSIKQILTF